MSEFTDKIKDMLAKNKLAAEKNKFDYPRTPTGATGRLDHGFVAGVIKPTIIYKTDAEGKYVPDGLGGYEIDYIASNEAREKKYDEYERRLNPNAYNGQ